MRLAASAAHRAGIEEQGATHPLGTCPMGVAENDDVGCGKCPLVASNEVPIEVLVGLAKQKGPDLVQKTKHQPWAAMDEH
jgi:hypothetical protein